MAEPKQRKELMTRDPATRAHGWLHWTGGLLLIVTGCAESPGPAQVTTTAPPIPDLALPGLATLREP